MPYVYFYSKSKLFFERIYSAYMYVHGQTSITSIEFCIEKFSDGGLSSTSASKRPHTLESKESKLQLRRERALRASETPRKSRKGTAVK